MELYPLSFVPKLSPRIWGGRRLAGYGKLLPEGVAIGESWEIFDRPGDSALVAAGELKGQSLQQLMLEWGPRLLGKKEYEKGHLHFPLMIKLIDAQDALSVQVHPDDEQALRMVGAHELGKTEMWVVLEAEPGATVVAGLKQGTTKEAFAAALKAGKLEAVLQELPVKPGDRIFIPAGRVHAIGKGCLIAEVQQNSDTTWRVYDYGRLDQGKPRELHISQAMECIRFDDAMQALPALVPAGPLSCEYFQVELWEGASQRRLREAGAGEPGFLILMGLRGRARLSCLGNTWALDQGGHYLIPACVDGELELLDGAQVLRAKT